MRTELLNRLSRISEEEQRILNGETEIRKKFYGTSEEFVIDRHRLMQENELITVRTHTRFVDFPIHSHNYIEMIYLCQGNITHIINGSEVIMNEGDILLLNRTSRHGVKAAGRNDIGINFLILPEFFDTALDMLEKDNVIADFLVGFLRKGGGETQYLHFELKDNLQIGNLIENLIYNLVFEENKNNIINKATMGLIFMHLLGNIKNLRQEAPTNYEDVAIRSALNYINQFYKTATLTELSANMNSSIPTMSRFIKKETGLTFKQLLQNKRFEVAVKLLRETTLSISDIITAVGYENNSYFHRRFRELYGMSPGEFRAKA